ncbi:PIN domain-containing protein [Nesterenkonia aerolata]|uniref:PIN domain-containing protein n=1 Tax=Nesterenkonia aerolata TaxID=3074079 RepID=A0ABU2DSR1_9MICC|nr:PIN domain-containing protein [Nesterenkonia sp. LY-0111]MDR8019421.1 PIN domain-containing protein [Nesterenkonia sp. LY-0111]
MFSAVLDTSVLWPSLQRDFLLSLAAERTYSPKWSTAILDELVFHEAEKLVGRGSPAGEAKQSAERLIDQMSSAFDDALVTDWEPLEGTYGLPDPDDEHVLATAVMCSAEVIVTENLKDFPESKLPSPIRVIPARDFVYDTVRAHLTQSCRAVIAICDRSGRQGPKLTTADLLTILEERYGMTRTTELLSTAPGLRDALP